MDNEKDVHVQTAELEMSSKTCLSLSLRDPNWHLAVLVSRCVEGLSYKDFASRGPPMSAPCSTYV